MQKRKQKNNFQNKNPHFLQKRDNVQAKKKKTENTQNDFVLYFVS